jgi:tight adherence protein C
MTRRIEQQERRRERVVQAGLYHRNAAVAFALVRVFLAVSLVGLGFIVSLLGWLPLYVSVLVGLVCGLVGTIAPSFWLDHVKRLRQTKIRRALPDALDVVVICLEGGMSLTGALARVARELGTAHPLLALELAIVERESGMGFTTGEALRRFANRIDLEELRSLSSVIIQVEKLGGSITKALTVYAETLRMKRHQRAEELAQKAAVKILFPTLFCIFPGLFIVILGPAAIRIYQTLLNGNIWTG